MVEISDAIVSRARAGDARAFEAILDAFQVPVFQTVYRLVGGRFPGDVEDITQDVFLKLFRALDRFDPERGVKFSTWVYAFVKNHCFDVLKKKRVPAVSLERAGAEGADGDGHTMELEAPTPRPDEQALSGETGRRIAEAVANLPEDQRLVFVLREYQGLEYREIAEIAECSEGTVKSRLYRAKEALRQSLRRYVLQ